MKSSESHLVVDNPANKEKKREDASRNFSVLLENANDAIFIIDPETSKFIDANIQAISSLGYTKDELLSLGVIDLEVVIPDKFSWKKHVQQVRKKGKMLLEGLHKRKDGTSFPVEISVKMVTHENVEYMIAIARDITTRRNTEDALRESEEKYKALYEGAPLPYQSLNEDGCFKEVNPEWLRVLGYSVEEVIGKWFGDFLHPEWTSHFAKKFPEFKKRGHVSGVHFKIKHKDGHYLDVMFEGCVGYHPDGSFKQTYCVFQDITERKNAERELKKNIEHEKLLLDSLPHPVMIINQKREVIAANKVALDVGVVLGDYCWKEFGKTDYISKKDKKKFCQGAVDGIKCTFCLADEAVRAEGMTNDPKVDAFGKIWDVFWKYLGVDENGIGLYMHYAIDITDRNQAEKNLVENRKLLSTSIDNMMEGYALHEAIFDRNGRMVDYRFLEFNKAAQKISKIKRSEIVGKTALQLYPHIVERGLMKRYADVMATGVSDLIEDFYYEGDSLNKAFDISCFRIDNKHFVCVFKDITGRKQAEELLLEQRVSLEQKNIALKEILVQIELEKKGIKDAVMENVTNIVFPSLDKLKARSKHKEQIEIVKDNLKSVTSSFGSRIGDSKLSLTPREMELCNYIKEGLSSKDIAALQNISLQTVHKHRYKIRKKLGILNDDVNLVTYLKSM